MLSRELIADLELWLGCNAAAVRGAGCQYWAEIENPGCLVVTPEANNNPTSISVQV